jgi:hypothetical protein
MVDEDDPNTQFTDAEFVSTVRAEQPVSTSEVAQSVGCTRRRAEQRLKSLRTDGKLNGDLIGNSLVWSISE